jgi:hypothetical protein
MVCIKKVTFQTFAPSTPFGKIPPSDKLVLRTDMPKQADQKQHALAFAGICANERQDHEATATHGHFCVSHSNFSQGFPCKPALCTVKASTAQMLVQAPSLYGSAWPMHPFVALSLQCAPHYILQHSRPKTPTGGLLQHRPSTLL